MDTKVDTLDSVELRPLQSAVSTNSPKISKFGSKVGFVIPKNKLSGSLVPIYRGSGKTSAADTIKEENNQQVHRKTKWGPDPTQDISVRKGRILAYQTRLEQITQLLHAGALGLGDVPDIESPTQMPSLDSSKVLVDESEKLVQLNFEKREIIGEILRLNPSYKAPSDYKPLQKEEKVPIPIKAYPGYNFIVLLLGPESNALKRLEEETGVKVRIQGTRADTGEKKEITQSDLNEAQSAYEELHVLVSAETYEKVDAAVALIELLLSPVIVNQKTAMPNLTSVNSESISDPSKVPTSGLETTPVSISSNSQTSAPQTTAPARPASMQYQAYSYPTWYPYPAGPVNIQMSPSSGYVSHHPVQNNALRYPVPPGNASIAPQPYNTRPPFAPAPRNSAAIPIHHAQPPMNSLQRPMMPQYPNIIATAQQPPGQQHTINRPMSFPSAPSVPMGVMPTLRPPPSQTTQLLSVFPVGLIPNQPLISPIPLGNSGWSNAPSVTPPPRPNNMQLPSQISLQRPPTAFQIMHPPQNFPSHAAGVSMSTSQAMPSFSSQSSPTGGFLSAPMQLGSAPVAPSYTPSLASAPPQGSIFPVGAQTPISAPLPTTTSGSVSGSVPEVSNPAAPPITAPKLPRPSSSDFTFQPVGSPTATQMTLPRPSNIQSTIPLPNFTGPPPPLVVPNAPQNLPGSTQLQVVPPPQSPSFRPAMQNPGMPVGAPVLPHTIPAVSASAMNMNIARAPPRPIYANSQNAANAPLNQQGPSAFLPSQPQSLGSALARPPMSNQHPNQLPHPVQPPIRTIPSQQLGGSNVSFVSGQPAPVSGGNQTYDPFSPTSIPHGVSLNQGAHPKVGKSETEVEYDNLMASMGVR